MMRKSRHLVELWQSLGLGRVPTRDRFKISNFPSLEPHLFVAAVAARLEDYRLILAGSAVEKSYGGCLRGLTFGELDLGPAGSEVVEEYELCAQKRVAIASRHRMQMSDESAVQLQRVLLPFDSPVTHGVSQVIGWFQLSPMPRGGTKGAVSGWTTEERAFIEAAV